MILLCSSSSRVFEKFGVFRSFLGFFPKLILKSLYSPLATILLMHTCFVHLKIYDSELKRMSVCLGFVVFVKVLEFIDFLFWMSGGCVDSKFYRILRSLPLYHFASCVHHLFNTVYLDFTARLYNYILLAVGKIIRKQYFLVLLKWAGKNGVTNSYKAIPRFIAWLSSH